VDVCCEGIDPLFPMTIINYHLIPEEDGMGSETYSSSSAILSFIVCVP
jgi:hypothetical protein